MRSERATVGRRASRALRAAVIAAAFLGAGREAGAQSVLVQVLGADSSQPLVGALGHLVTPSGDAVVTRLADGNGRVLFTGLEPGRYRVRAEMLGHATEESEVFSVEEGGSVPLVLRLQSRAIPLAAVQVTAESGPCERRPAQEGRLLADVWDEVRKALSAAAVTDQQGIYRYSLITYEQDLDRNGVIVTDEQTPQRGYMRTPFASRAVEDLTEEGFVRRSASEWIYHAPDAGVLLSDPFLDTHCFRLVEGGPREAGLLGLAFEPTGENERLPDISGTLWLDRDSVALRWLEFPYENLEPEVRPGDATGRVEFQRMPEGAWIVPEWWIRMPLVEIESGRSDRRRITGFHRSGGRVVEILEAGGRDLGQGVSTGAIEGLVVDSLGLPLQGVRVGTAGSSQSIFTNAEGRFNLVRLAEGTYRIQFVDPDLEALGLESPTITREVAAGVSSYVEIIMPSPAALLKEACGAEAAPSTSVLGGVVRDAATGEPIEGATVGVRWSAIRLTGARSGVIGRESYTEVRTTTNPLGVFFFCSVPRQTEMEVAVGVDEVEIAAETVTLGGEEEGRILVVTPERR